MVVMLKIPNSYEDFLEKHPGNYLEYWNQKKASHLWAVGREQVN